MEWRCGRRKAQKPIKGSKRRGRGQDRVTLGLDRVALGLDGAAVGPEEEPPGPGKGRLRGGELGLPYQPV